MADWTLTRQNIAAKAGNVAGIEFASADDIGSALEDPAVLVTHTGNIQTLERGPGYELRRADIKGLLALSRSPSVGQAGASADGLIELLFIEFRSGIQLGQAGIVQDSWLESAEEESDITIGGVEYIGYRLTWPVVVRENVTRTA